MKKITTWLKCEYPGCHVETDSGYEVKRKGMRLKVCMDCYMKIKMAKHGIS